MCRWRLNVSTTCSRSPARRQPVSTKTQVSWSNSTMNKQCRHGRIDTTREATNDSFAAYKLTNLLYGFVNHRTGCPIRFTATDAKKEVTNDLLSLCCVGNFGMELQANSSLWVGNRSYCIAFGAGKYAETGRQFVYTVTMAHPDW